MKTKVTTLFTLLLLFAFTTMLKAQITERAGYFKNKPSLGGEATLIKVEKDVLDNESYTNFELTVPSSGYYYVNFWLLPVELADGSFSPFKILINGSDAGQIIPAKGNWQSIGLPDNAKIYLLGGSNIISVVAGLPIVPEVEFLRVSEIAGQAVISSAAYDAYLSEAQNIEKCRIAAAPTVASDQIEVDNNEINMLDNGLDFGSTRFYNVPVRYSAHVELNFKTGEEVLISTQSGTPHFLEFFSELSAMSFTVISSSVAASGSAIQSATIRATAPRAGTYVVKVRTTGNGKSGTVNIKVNDLYSFSNLPIYYMGVSYAMPADGQLYGSYTVSNAASYTDPILFIEDVSTPAKVIAFNDDASSAISSKLGLMPKDSYLIQSYPRSTKGAHVTNFFSYNPDGYCDIVMGEFGLPALSPSSDRSMDGDGSDGTTGMAETAKTEINVYPNPVDASSVLSVSSAETYTNLEVYTVSGSRLQSSNIDDTTVRIPLTELGMNLPGIYIVKLLGAGETVTKKVIVK